MTNGYTGWTASTGWVPKQVPAPAKRVKENEVGASFWFLALFIHSSSITNLTYYIQYAEGQQPKVVFLSPLAW
jgi:hypothetical protein